MPIDTVGLVRPHVVEMTKREDVPYAAEFRVQPLERGFGHTLGNALRRMLLSSLRGTAVWGFRFDGVVHEHQTIPGVVEDIHQIIQRLKALTLRMPDEVTEAVLEIKVSKAGPVLAKDISPSTRVEIVHPEHLLFTLQEEKEFAGELYVNKGRGYVEASQHVTERARRSGEGPSLPVDLVRIDAVYNPVRRVNFTVQETRVGQRTDFDSLVLLVETNGAIMPEDAVSYGAALLQEHFKYFLDFGRVPTVSGEGLEDVPEGMSAEMRDLLAKPIDECGLSVRSINSLKNSSINTLGDLVKYSRDDLLKVKNLGEKALQEIEEMLQKEGLTFGMQVEEPGELVTTQQGAAPAGEAVPPAPGETPPEA